MPTGSDIRAGRAFVEVYADGRRARSELDQIKGDLKQWDKDVEKVGKGFWEGLAQSAKAQRREARSSGETALEQAFKSGGGLGSFAARSLGFGLQAAVAEAIGRSLSEATKKAAELSLKFAEGKVNAGDMVAELAKSVPILGSIGEIAENLIDIALANEIAAQKKINDQLRERNKLDKERATAKANANKTLTSEDLGLEDSIDHETARQGILGAPNASREHLTQAEADRQQTVADAKKAAESLKKFDEEMDKVISADKADLAGKKAGAGVNPANYASFEEYRSAIAFNVGQAQSTLNADEAKRAEGHARIGSQLKTLGTLRGSNESAENANKAAEDADKQAEVARNNLKKLATEREDQQHHLNDLQIEGMEDGLEKSLAMIDEKYAYEIQRAKDAGDDITILQKEQAQERANAEVKDTVDRLKRQRQDELAGISEAERARHGSTFATFSAADFAQNNGIAERANALLDKIAKNTAKLAGQRNTYGP